MKDIEQDLLYQSTESNNRADNLTTNSINNSMLPNLSTVYKKSDETQPEIIGFSNNLPEVDLISSIQWSETFDSSSEDIPGELIKVAETLELGQVYVPCYADPKEEKKPPVKEVAKTWTKTQYSPLELAPFPTMETLSVFLGDEIGVQDIDGTTALDTLELFLETGGYSEEARKAIENTLWTSSDRQTRFGIWWKIPEKYRGLLKFKSITTGDKEQLEFRNGDHYQAVAGMHPKSGMYWSNGKHPLEMPEEICELWLNIQGGDRKSPLEPKKAPEIDTTDFQLSAVQTLLGYLQALGSAETDTENYNLWLRVGMIIHSVDDSEKGLQIWDEWSKDLKEDENGNLVITNPKYQPGTCEKKWASFDSEGDTISIGSLYYWLNEESEKISDPVKKAECQGAISNCKAITSPKWSLEDVISDFISQNWSGLKAQEEIGRIAKQFGRTPQNIQELIEREEKELTPTEVQNCLESSTTAVEVPARSWLQNFEFGKLLLAHADSNGIPLENLFFPFLVCCSIFHKKTALFWLTDTIRINPNLFLLLVADPKQGKTPCLNTFTRSLDKWLAKAEEQDELNKELYEMAKQAAKADNQPFTEPPPTPTHIWTYGGATAEVKRSFAGKYTERGLLYDCHEYKNIITQLDQHSNRPGIGDSVLLAGFDCGRDKTKRKTSDEMSGSYDFSLLGGIQPDVIPNYFDFDRVGDGKESRFVFLPMTPYKLKKNFKITRGEKTKTQQEIFEDRVEAFYNAFVQCSQNTKFLAESEKLAECWDSWKDSVEQKYEGLSKPTRIAIERFAEDITLRITFIIHQIKEVGRIVDQHKHLVTADPEAYAGFQILAEKAEMNEEISLQTLKEAIEIADWLIPKLKYVWENCKGYQPNGLPGGNSEKAQFQAILDYAKGKAIGVTSSELSKLAPFNKITVKNSGVSGGEVVRKRFQQLVEAGKGKMQGDKFVLL